MLDMRVKYTSMQTAQHSLAQTNDKAPELSWTCFYELASGSNSFIVGEAGFEPTVHATYIQTSKPLQDSRKGV